jgi:hypothetical protein
LQELDFEPYLNADCTPYFENSVIIDLYNKGLIDGDYFGVLAPSYLSKIGFLRACKIANLTNRSDAKISKQLILSTLENVKPDILDLMRHEPHNTIDVANRFHPEFKKYFGYIMHQIGFHYKPKVYQHVNYCNYQICKPDIYRKYIEQMLIPSIEVMKDMKELWGNAHYSKQLPTDLIAKFGVSHYPYHTFICERLFTVWADSTTYKFYHL